MDARRKNFQMVEARAGLPILTFGNTAAFDSWLDAHEAHASGLWLKFAKKGAPEATLTKQEAVDVALCHGWIDGQLDKYDEHYWLVRFTPRKARSRWSKINRTRAMHLVAEGRMRASGLNQIDAAKADGRWETAYAPARSAEIPPELATALAASPRAAAFFASLKGANRYAILYRIAAAKKAETRARRIAKFVAMLERGETIHG